MSRIAVKSRHKPGRGPVPRRGRTRSSFPSLAQQELFLERFEECLNVLTARKCAEITKEHFEDLFETDPLFREAMRQIVARSPDKAELRLFEAAISEDEVQRPHNMDAIKTVLQAWKPERYGTKSKLELTIQDVTKMSDDELAEAWERARAKHLA